MTLRDLKKKPVVSMADGTKVGEVDDLVIDLSRWSIGELYVVGQPGRGLLFFSTLKGIGPDAVTVERADHIVYNTKPSGICFATLHDLHVVDGSGTVRGNVDDLNFESDGTIRSLEIKEGGVFGIGAKRLLITPADVRGVGDKILTVELPSQSPASS